MATIVPVTEMRDTNKFTEKCKKSPQCGEEYFSVDVLDKINSNMKNKYNNKEKVNLLDYSKTA